MELKHRIERIWQDRKVLEILVRRDLRVRYARSVLGYLWTLIDPLSQALVYWFVFGLLMARSDAAGLPFIIYLIAGILCWQWFNNCVNETARAITAERALVRSTGLPRELWVIRVVLAKGVEFMLSLPILLIFVIIFMIQGDDVQLNWRIIMIVPAILIQMVMSIGIGLVMAPVTALADDIVRLVRIALRFGFYFTPILYPLSLVESRAAKHEALSWVPNVMMLNPFVGITDMYRIGLTDPAVHAQHSVYPSWGFAVLIALFWLVVGMLVFRRLEPAVLKEI
ncbi:ABC transporter permease [Dermacoccaceae bacterium W4C1]